MTYRISIKRGTGALGGHWLEDTSALVFFHWENTFKGALRALLLLVISYSVIITHARQK